MTGSRIRAEDGPTEVSPLLPNGDEEHEVPPSSPSRRNAWSARFKFHPAYLIIPVLFGTRFAAVITSTPTIEIFRQLVCRWWLAANDPDSLPSDGSPPSDEQCGLPGVEQAFSVVVTVDAVVTALGSIITSGIISHFGSRYGRKPVLLALVCLKALSTACFLGAVSVVPGTLQNVLLVAWIIMAAFSSVVALSLTCNMYVVDMTQPSERTFFLSVAMGFAVLGAAPTYWLGGYISRHSSVVAVFWCKFITAIALIFYVILILPESFSTENREAARREMELQRSAVPPQSHSKLVTLLRRPLDTMKSILEPLKHLKPSHNPITGRRNFRLLIITISQAFTGFGADYVGSGFVILATVRFNFKSEQLGLALSAYTFAQAFWLSVPLPAILRWGRPFYNNRWSHRHPTAQHSINSNFDDVDQPTALGTVDSTMASHFDVYIAIVSSLIWALATAFIGVAPTTAMITAALVLLSLGAGYEPAIKSVATASADPLHSGQVLAAMAIVGSVASLLSPIVLGAILSSTLMIFPQLVFFICSATMIVGAALLFLVRDSDRHVKTPHEEE